MVFRRVRAEVIFGRGTGVETHAVRQLLQIVQTDGQGLPLQVRKGRDRCARVAAGVEFNRAAVRDRSAVAVDDTRPAVLRRHGEIRLLLGRNRHIPFPRRGGRAAYRPRDPVRTSAS
jgi:hypothetical protein